MGQADLMDRMNGAAHSIQQLPPSGGLHNVALPVAFSDVFRYLLQSVSVGTKIIRRMLDWSPAGAGESPKRGDREWLLIIMNRFIQ